MGLKSKEDFIREKTLNELNEVIGHKANKYCQEELIIANEELFRRRLKNMNPIEQIDSVTLLPDNVLKYLVEDSGGYYNSAIFSVARAEYKKRGLEIEEWYYLVEGQKNGPVGHTELQKLVENKYLNDNSYIFKVGMTEWTTMDRIHETPISSVDSINFEKKPIVKSDNSDSEALSDIAAIFSFLFPIIGIVIYFSNENSPKGKRAGNIALVSIAICAFFYLMVFTTIFR